MSIVEVDRMTLSAQLRCPCGELSYDLPNALLTDAVNWAKPLADAHRADVGDPDCKPFLEVIRVRSYRL